MYRSFEKLAVKTALKSIDFWRFDEVTDKNELAPFYGPCRIY